MHFVGEKVGSVEEIDPIARHLIDLNLLDRAGWERWILEGQGERRNWLQCLLRCQEEWVLKVAREVARFFGVQWLDLGGLGVEGLVKDVVDIKFIQQHQVLPLSVCDGQLSVAIGEPGQLEVMGEIKFHTDLLVQPVMVEWAKLARLIDAYVTYCQYNTISHFQLATAAFKDDAQVVHFVRLILLDAVRKKASDMHFEPYKTAYRLRFRIDGILHKITQIPLDLALRISTRLKVLSKLDIAERRLPQDGRFTFEVDEQSHKDCRISTCPTLFGEKIVVRILDGEKNALQIEDLGLEEVQKNIFLHSIARPQGMFLVTGPTGSGKSRTLYTAMEFLNTLERNISTVEDPVEIQLPGVNQVNINPKINLNFATVLRAFLRQDPDIIMVGEMRDQETAEIAIKAAQTGHLVLSTLHNNNTVDAVMRLQSMGISVFNIIHSIQVIIAQRLVRKLCNSCKVAVNLTEELDFLRAVKGDFLKNVQVYRPVGCDSCMQGYSGRTGVFEILKIEGNVERRIGQGATVEVIRQAAEEQGMLSLYAAALKKVQLGITSLEEVNRIID